MNCNKKKFVYFDNAATSFYKPKEVKQQFMKAFEHAVRGTKWRPPQDSTSVMTLRVVDTENSRIEYGCDLAIVFYSDDGRMHYLHSHKNGGYSFYPRGGSEYIDEKVDEILEYYGEKDGWSSIKDMYLRIKNSNRDPDKRSFMLYIEAVNNVYDKYSEDKYWKECNDDFDYDDDD